MPNVIDNGDTEREELPVFIQKHLPCNMHWEEVTQKMKHWWQDGPTIAFQFYLLDEDDEEEENVSAEISLDQPNIIIVFDRSFLEDFTELAAKYERYNPNVTVTVIVKKLEGG
jgi:hypothetical protein